MAVCPTVAGWRLPSAEGRAPTDRQEAMSDTFDLLIIGAGEAGQAAAYLARERSASVAIADRELFGGSCPFWAGGSASR